MALDVAEAHELEDRDMSESVVAARDQPCGCVDKLSSSENAE